MKKLRRGMLIAIEGIDGSGKSTLIKNLAYALADVQLPVVTTQEPGGTPLGKQLRALLQERTIPVASKAEFLMFATDRAQHFHDLILPALATHSIVISDRMADSSLVYQGYGRGLDMDILRSVNSWAMDGRSPDLTIYLRITPDIAYERFKTRKKLTAFEQEKEAFFTRLVHGFDTIFSHRSDVLRIDGQETPDQLTKMATAAITHWLTTHDAL
jgi:dTMP kinase